MVVLFDWPVLCGLVVPSVQAKFPDGVFAAAVNFEGAVLEIPRRRGNTGDHIIDRPQDLVFLVPVNDLDKRRRRRVHDDLPHRQFADQLFQLCVIFFVGLVGALVAAGIVVFADARCRLAVPAPEPDGKRV